MPGEGNARTWLRRGGTTTIWVSPRSVRTTISSELDADRTMLPTHTTHLRRLVEVPSTARRLYPRGAPFGLDQAALQVLIALALGDTDETNGLVEALALERSAVSHSLRELTDRRLVVRASDPNDGCRRRLSV